MNWPPASGLADCPSWCWDSTAPKTSTTQWYVTERFSRLALICVGFLVLSGTIMSVLYIGSWSAVLGTAYGVMVLAKATMLGALLILGGVNFLLLRNTPREHALPRLRRLIEAEVGIGITVILTAASLTSQPPAVDQVSETVSLQQIYQRFKPRMPRLTYEYVTGGGKCGARGKWHGTRQQAAGLQHRRTSADDAADQQLDRVGVEPPLDGPGGAGDGPAGAAGAHRQGSVGGVLAAVADRHRHLHLSSSRHRVLARGMEELRSVLGRSRGVSASHGGVGVRRIRHFRTAGAAAEARLAVAWRSCFR